MGRSWSHCLQHVLCYCSEKGKNCKENHHSCMYQHKFGPFSVLSAAVAIPSTISEVSRVIPAEMWWRWRGELTLWISVLFCRPLETDIKPGRECNIPALAKLGPKKMTRHCFPWKKHVLMAILIMSITTCSPRKLLCLSFARPNHFTINKLFYSR